MTHDHTWSGDVEHRRLGAGTADEAVESTYAELADALYDLKVPQSIFVAIDRYTDAIVARERRLESEWQSR